MASGSDLVILLLLCVTCSLHRGVVTNDCKSDGDIETSNCLGCSGCYQIVESTYNLTLQAHNNFTANYEHFQNLTQMGVSQVVEEIRSLLEEHHQLAIRTAATERNVISQLFMIQNQTIRIQNLSDVLEPVLSAVANTNQEVTTSHDNNIMNTTELDVLVTTISYIISNNITTLLSNAELAYNESIAKLEELAVVAATANMTSHQQEDLTMAIVSIVEEAHNISTTALNTICWALQVQNTTRALIDQLNTANVPRVSELVQQVEPLMVWIQQTSPKVFNRSEELVTQVPDDLPSHDIKSLNRSVSILHQNASQLSDDAHVSFRQLQSLKEQADNLNATVTVLLQKGVGLEEIANRLLASANASLINSRQGYSQAQPVIDEINILFTNLTKYSDLIKQFNANLTKAMAKLAEAGNVTSDADGETLVGQSDVEHARQMVEEARSLLDGARQTYGKILTALDSSWMKINDISKSLPDQQLRATSVIEQAGIYRGRVKDIDERIVNQTSDLHRINQTSLTVQDDLTFILKQLEQVRNELAMLSGRLNSLLPVSQDDLQVLNETVSRLSAAVEENGRLIEAAQEKLSQLTKSTDQLEDKNKQLKQHRDLLRKIKDNIGSYMCTLAG